MLGPSDLLTAVHGHTPTTDADSHVVALAALRTGRPMWPRSEFDPGHFTVSGFVASPDRQSMLLIHHGRLRRWLQPGGHIEQGDESIEVAARREVVEETSAQGLVRVGSGLVRIDAHPIPARPDEPEHVHIDLGVGFVAGSDEIGPLDEVLDAKWVRFDDFGDFDLDAAVLGGALRLRALLGQN